MPMRGSNRSRIDLLRNFAMRLLCSSTTCSSTCAACIAVTIPAFLQAFGIQHATDMCKRILAAGIPGLHLYTLNLERSAIAILENLEIIPRVKTRSLPWRQPANGKRTGESVRPVFWANRPAAYIKRTSDWDQASQSLGLCPRAIAHYSYVVAVHRAC